ncbi:MAG: hypothetical protein WCS70_12400 [Verrucomicrobiota bacterium]
MKPTTVKKNHTNNQVSPAANLPAPPRRVAVEFLPHSGWQVDIGHTPVKAFAAPQTMRDKKPVTHYKRAQGRSQFPHAFVPMALVIDAEKKRATRRHMECRATPKLPVNL